MIKQNNAVSNLEITGTETPRKLYHAKKYFFFFGFLIRNHNVLHQHDACFFFTIDLPFQLFEDQSVMCLLIFL